MDWESLPTVRELEDRFSEDSEEIRVNPYGNFVQNKNLKEIEDIFDLLGLSATRNTLKSGVKNGSIFSIICVPSSAFLSL